MPSSRKHGVQAAPGGVIENNMDNPASPIGMSNVARIVTGLKSSESKAAKKNRRLRTLSKNVSQKKAFRGQESFARNAFDDDSSDGDESGKPIADPPADLTVEAVARVLIPAAGRGDVGRLFDLIDRGWVHPRKGVDCALVNGERHCGETPLLRAMRFGHVEAVELLLEEGADPMISDTSGRMPWYYAFFGINVPDDKRAELVDLLAAHVEHVPPSVVLMSMYTRHTGLKRALLDHLGYTLLSRDTMDNCQVIFAALNTLDDCTASCRWPDGSTTRPGETAATVALRTGDMEAMTHPSMMALVYWKWEKFGRRIAVIEFACYFTVVVCFSLMVAFWGSMQRNLAQDEDMTSSVYYTVAGYLERVALAITAGLMAMECFMMARERGRGIMMERVMDHVNALLSYICIFLTCALSWMKFSQSTIATAAAYTTVAIWLRLRYYAELSRFGPFFIMVAEMMKRDVLRFVILLLVVMPGFALGLSTLFSVDCDEDNSPAALNVGDWNQLGEASYSLILLMFGLQAMPRGLCGSSNSVFTEVLFVGFLILVPLLLLNLLIAMFSETYSRIQAISVHYHAVGWCRYVITREVLLPRRFVKFDVTGSSVPLSGGGRRVFSDHGSVATIRGYDYDVRFKYGAIFLPPLSSRDKDAAYGFSGLGDVSSAQEALMESQEDKYNELMEQVKSLEGIVKTQGAFVKAMAEKMMPGCSKDIETELAQARKQEARGSLHGGSGFAAALAMLRQQGNPRRRRSSPDYIPPHLAPGAGAGAGGDAGAGAGAYSTGAATGLLGLVQAASSARPAFPHPQGGGGGSGGAGGAPAPQPPASPPLLDPISDSPSDAAGPLAGEGGLPMHSSSLPTSVGMSGGGGGGGEAMADGGGAGAGADMAGPL